MPLLSHGLDEEALTDLELEARVRQVEGALRGLPEGSCLYQYTRVMSGFELPRQKKYRNEVTETFAMTASRSSTKRCVPANRSSLVPDAGAIEGEGLRAHAERECR